MRPQKKVVIIKFNGGKVGDGRYGDGGGSRNIVAGDNRSSHPVHSSGESVLIVCHRKGAEIDCGDQREN